MTTDGSFDAAAFSKKAKADLLALLESVPGRKNLVIEKALVGPIELCVTFSSLQDHGVDRVFFLENNNTDSSQKNVIYIARGDKPARAEAIAKQIKSIQGKAQISHEFSVFWVPRRTLVCEKMLEQAGILGDVTSKDLPLYFQYLDDGLLSLEMEDSFGDLYLNKDPTSLHVAAKALMTIQEQQGLFPRIIGKGDHAHRLAELLQRMKTEVTSEASSTLPTTATMPSSALENLIIIDRETDFASPLLTQLTYDGLLDEIFTIRHNATEVESSVMGSAPPQQQAAPSSSNVPQPTSLTRKVLLTPTDTLYASLRNTHFTLIGSLLNRVARRIQNLQQSQSQQKTTAELSTFVAKLKESQAEQVALKTHTSLLDEILKRTANPLFRAALDAQQSIVAGAADTASVHEALEDLSARGASLKSVLRLLCLESVTGGGLRPRDLDAARRVVTQAYGYQHLITLEALEQAGLITTRAGTFAGLPGTGERGNVAQATNYAAARRALQLIVEDVSEEDPKDIAYVYSGYAPLSVRLVQAVLQKSQLAALTKSNVGAADAEAGWRGFEGALSNVHGRSVDEGQGSRDKAVKARQVLGSGAEKTLRTSVVMFVGGITFAEIAALRFISRQEEEAGRRRILICTTSILSGDKMMDAAIARSEPKQAT